MPKLIVEVPARLLSDAKAMAAKTGNPLGSIVRGLLEGFVQNEAGPLTGNFEILLGYSLGRISVATAAKQLHLDSESALNKLAIDAGLPVPRLGLQETESMRKRFSETLDRAALDQKEAIHPSLADQECFAQAILSPPQPSPALERAFTRRSKLRAK